MKTKIAWTDYTANFWWGCVKVSEGCQYCYAETLSKRNGKNIWGPAKTSEREPKKAVWKEILKWDKLAKEEGVRRRVFIQSMSDFLEDHPILEEIRNNAMDVIESLEHLDILILTKRPENARRFLSRWWNDFPAHVWMGTSVETQKRAEERIPYLLDIPAKIRFLSVEPQLEKIYLDLIPDCFYDAGMPFEWQRLSADNERRGINWVIVGGESGAHCRPFDIQWAYELKKECKDAGVAFFMKQLGGNPYKRDEMEDFPKDLRIREFPELAVKS